METENKKALDFCEYLGVEENQEFDIYSQTESAIPGNPHYIKNNDLYDREDKVSDSALLKLLKREYRCEPVIHHLKEGEWYYYCFLPEAYSKVDRMVFDKFNDSCVLNAAIGNMFVREERAKENMDKVRKKLDAVRSTKAFIRWDEKPD